MQAHFVHDLEDKGISSRIPKGPWDDYFLLTSNQCFVPQCNNVYYHVEFNSVWAEREKSFYGTMAQRCL